MNYLIVLFTVCIVFHNSNQTFAFSHHTRTDHHLAISDYPTVDSTRFLPKNYFVIIGKPRLIQRYGSMGLYTVVPDSVLFGSIRFNKCGVIFIYGNRRTIENSTIFFLVMNYYATMDTAVTHFISSMYYSVRYAEKASDYPIKTDVYDNIGFQFLSEPIQIPVSVRAFKRDKIERKVIRWQRRNCRN